MRLPESPVIVVLLFILLAPTGLGAGEEKKNLADDLVFICSGEFLMGSPINNRETDSFRSCDGPQRRVSVQGFYISRHLVTAEEYCEFLNEEGNHNFYLSGHHGEYHYVASIVKRDGKFCPQEGRKRSPAYAVTWVGAQSYCDWFSRTKGRRVRLPTEKEWEYAARGSALRVWPWGDAPPIQVTTVAPRVSLFRDLANIMDFSSVVVARRDLKPHHILRGPRWELRYPELPPVGSYPENATPEGVYDMLGYYAGQWCSDVYENDESNNVEGEANQANEAFLLRVVRGQDRVIIDHKSFQPRFRIARAIVGGDGGVPLYTAGRSWSRSGCDPTEIGAMFRIAAAQEDGIEK